MQQVIIIILFNAHPSILYHPGGETQDQEDDDCGYVIEELTVPKILERLDNHDNHGKIKVHAMYTYMTATMRFLDWGLAHLKECLHRWAVSVEVMRLPQSVLDDIMVTESQAEFFARFINLPHATWFDLHIFEYICINSPDIGMTGVVACFKTSYYKAKLRDVYLDIPERKVLPGYTLIRERYERKPDDMTIFDLKDHQRRVEMDILGLPIGTMVVCFVVLDKDYLQAGWLIPSKADALAYKNMCKNFEKLAGEALTYLEVGGYQSIIVPLSLTKPSSNSSAASAEAVKPKPEQVPPTAPTEATAKPRPKKNRNLGQETPTQRQFKLWEGLPVLPCGAVVKEVGPMQREPDSRREPYPLPSGFVWESMDIDDLSILEEVVTFVCPNSTYKLSQYRVAWLLRRPGWRRDWMVGIRVASTKRLVGMICGVPSKIAIGEEIMKVILFRYIRVHKKYGGKRMEYMLVREVMRRANKHEFYQGIIFQPQTMLHCIVNTKSWQFTLTQRILIHHGYIAAERSHFKVPRFIKTPGLRKIRKDDLPKAFKFVNNYLSKYFIRPVFDDEDIFSYVFMSKPKTITTYVVADKTTGEITDMFSFMHSWLIYDQETGDFYYEAAMYYFFSTVTPQKQLLTDALVLAKNDGCDSFQAIDMPIDRSIFHEMNFFPGNTMYMSLYNYQCPELPISEVYCPSL